MSCKGIFTFAAGISFLCCSPGVFAQWTVRPAPREADTGTPAARTRSLSPMPLPFWDDFSFTPVGNPNDTLWANSNTVRITAGKGIKAPTIHVVTFDGLNADGVPYDPNDILINGFTDSLVSRPIKMTTVPPQNRDSVFLSFCYQWRGYGEPPDPADFLRIEFRTDQNQWESLLTIKPDSTIQADTFYVASIKISDTRFFHDNFQFRFRGYGRLSGPYDEWNIDYVYLNEHRYAGDLSFPDRAIASQVTHLFDPYSAIPSAHFFNTPTFRQPQFDVYNLRDADATTLSYLVTGVFDNYKDGAVFRTEAVLGDTTPINVTNGVIRARHRRTVTFQYLPDPSDASQFDPDADSIHVRLRVRLFSGDVININDGQPSPDYSPAYEPIDFRSNDTTSLTLFIKDYYAYDDGSAEYAAGLTQPGNRAALRFELATPGGDTLTGVSIHYPYFGGASSSTMDFSIYSDANGMPGQVLSQQLIPVRRSGPDIFTRIALLQHVVVPHVFYLGWQEPVNGSVYIGLDKSNDTGNLIYVNTNGPWDVNTDVSGSLMIHPVFGKGNVITGIADESESVRIYPNPCRGSFYVEGEVHGLQVYTSQGQRGIFSLAEEGDRTRVNLIGSTPGIYLVRYLTRNGMGSTRVLVTD